MSKKDLIEAQEPEMQESPAAEAIVEEAPAAKKDKATIIAELVELGRSKGKLTDQEIMNAMELLDFDPEQMEKLYEQLEQNHIEVLDDFANVDLENLDFTIENPEPETVEEILAFLQTVKGINPESAKGFYEGTYTVECYETGKEKPVFQIGFGDTPAFYYGENAEDSGYPNRYVLDGMTLETVIEFFGKFFP